MIQNRRKKYNPKLTLPIKTFIPSIVTIAGMCIGLTSVKMAILGQIEQSINLILIACILDFLDGSIARALKSTTSFGSNLDSLCDVVNFGICPTLILYIWGTSKTKLGWAVGLFFAACMCVRLARFNVQSLTKDEKMKALSQRFFQGIPAPAGALLNLIPVYISIYFDGLEISYLTFASTCFSFLIGIGLISHIPTFCLKKISVARRSMFCLVLCTNLLIALFMFDTALGLIISGFLYLCSIPLSCISYKKALSKIN